jgi:hypothetical protein
MVSHRKKAQSRKRQNRRWVIAALVLVAVVVVSAAAYLSLPKTPVTSPDTPEGLQTLANHYIEVMKTLNSSQTKTAMTTQLGSHYNQTDLFTWEHSKLTFESDPAGNFEAPAQILSEGKGVYVQWSIVYTAACLSQGYQSRLVAAVDTATWSYIHMWAEDYVNGTWIHVDPSDSVWNQPSRYLSWEGWGSGIGSTITKGFTN